MTMEFTENGQDFCQRVFDDVRKLTADRAGVTRQGYGAGESATVEYLRNIGRELELEIVDDPAGNVWMRLPGRDRDLPALVAGSHADSVLEGGNYDGLAGIVAALHTVREMRRQGFTPRRDVVVLIMRCEESSFYGKCYIGSLAFTGGLTAADTALLDRDKARSLADHMRESGFDPEALTTGRPLVDLKAIAAFIELHIEQGPTLDSSDTVRVGVVTGIRGNLRHKQARVIGETAHSGAVDKPFRHDAVLALAEFLNRMDQAWDEVLAAGGDLVFTAGIVNTAPTAGIAVVPGEVSFAIDMRSLDMATLEAFHGTMARIAAAVGQARGVRFEFGPRIDTASSRVDEALMRRLQRQAEAMGLPHRLMPSGAGHDAAVIGARGVPVAMIFVANQNGSHNPHEAMRIEDFMLGAELLRETAFHFDDAA